MPYPYLYHATRKANLPSIQQYGLLTRYYGVIHGSMEVHPPKPAIYLARDPNSNNLHGDLFDGSPLVVFKIATAQLDPNEMWPDDAIYSAYAEEYVFHSGDVPQIARAFGLSNRVEAKEMLNRLNSATDDQLPLLMKPCWRWYLKWRQGGEVAYTADIPASAIADVRDYDTD